MEAYKVTINWTSKVFRKASFYLGIIAIIGLYIWYVFDYPTRGLPSEFRIYYYFEFLPRWLTNFFIVSFLISLISFFFFDIRRNTRGILKINNDYVVLESRIRSDLIKFVELKRITFVALPIAFRPYRIEFIYPDFSFKRIVTNKKRFYQLMDKLHEVVPDEFEIEVNSFESIQK